MSFCEPLNRQAHFDRTSGHAVPRLSASRDMLPPPGLHTDAVVEFTDWLSEQGRLGHTAPGPSARRRNVAVSLCHLPFVQVPVRLHYSKHSPECRFYQTMVSSRPLFPSISQALLAGFEGEVEWPCSSSSFLFLCPVRHGRCLIRSPSHRVAAWRLVGWSQGREQTRIAHEPAQPNPTTTTP